MFDGETFRSEGGTVLVDDGRIVGVEARSAALPEGCQVTEFAGATVLPGLIDMHVHLCGDAADGALDKLSDYSDEELDAVIAKSLQDEVAGGVTTVRDLGDRQWAVVAWRDRLAAVSTDRCLPTIVASGPPITSPGGHCWNMGGEVQGRAELRAAVRERAERRVDVVKVMASGGFVTAGTEVMACQFSLDDLSLIVDEAHGCGLGVTAHAHGLPAVHQALDAGVDGIEHCTCMTETGITLSDELVGRLASAGVVVCPTLGGAAGTAPPPAVLALLARTGRSLEAGQAARRAAFARMHKGGVTIASGSDAGIGEVKPHGVLARGVGALAAGGVPVAEALASATSVAAKAAGLGPSKGRLQPGYDADLLVIDGDLGHDVEGLEQVQAVYLRGRRVPPER
jgi:imidazolonepropionase-like amidohydrolase